MKTLSWSVQTIHQYWSERLRRRVSWYTEAI